MQGHKKITPKLYEKPQTMEFIISEQENDIILKIIGDGGANDGKTVKLRLTKK